VLSYAGSGCVSLKTAKKIFGKFRGSFADGVVIISSTSVVELLGASPSPGDARRVFP
jgi:hypothetical protein